MYHFHTTQEWYISFHLIRSHDTLGKDDFACCYKCMVVVNSQLQTRKKKHTSSWGTRWRSWTSSDLFDREMRLQRPIDNCSQSVTHCSFVDLFEIIKPNFGIDTYSFVNSFWCVFFIRLRPNHRDWRYIWCGKSGRDFFNPSLR